MMRLDRGDTVAEASAHFVRATSKLRDAKKKERRRIWLARYDAWRTGAAMIGSDWRARPLLLIGNVELGGQVDRVDFLQGTMPYRGILLSEDQPPEGWRDEPQYPLLQLGLANRYGRPVDEFGIGIQKLDGSEPEVTIYSSGEIERAAGEFRRLARRISQLMR
jgi:hypothetical protein